MGTVRLYALVLLMHNKQPKIMCEAAKVILFGCVIYNKHPKTSCQAAKVIHLFIMNTQKQ